MRCVISLFLLGVLMLNLFGFYAQFIWQQSQLKSSARIALASHDDKDATTFTLTESAYKALKWSDPGEEFTLNGEFYDVVTVTHTNAGYKITARDDNRETGLVKAFVSLFSNHTQNGDGGPVKNLLQHLQKEFIPNQGFAFLIPGLTGVHYHIASYSRGIGVSPAILVPPPCA